MGAGAGVAQPCWLCRRVVKQMEHRTGPCEADDGGTAADWETGAAAADRDTAAGAVSAAPAVRTEPVPATGEPRVDAALKLLDRLPGLPVSEHPELFERVHAQLSDVLGELDSGPAGPASA